MVKWQQWRKTIGLDALEYPVPVHANSLWYALGGISLTCFGVAFLTGMILTQFYNPTPQVAHASVRYMSASPGLSFIRALHHWSANLGFIVLIAHMLRVMVTGAFRPPRTAIYIVGVVMFVIAFQMYFTGTVLKWDQEGYEAMIHFVAVNKLLGPLGVVFQEDFTLSTSMLARLYALHVGVFPALFLCLVFLHVLFVKHFGIAPKRFQSKEDYRASLSSGETFLNHLNKLMKYGALVLAILFLLSFLFKPTLLDAPKPGIEVTKPPWLFWIFYPIESAIGIVGILVGSIVFLGGLILVPILGHLIEDENRLYKVINGLVGTKTAIFRLTGMFGKYDLGAFQIESDDFTQVLNIPSDISPGTYRLTVEGGGKSAKVVINVN
ncbi:MAG: cytochrome bc complex cytochrome b subunit [Deltaproteobacteria bacterium]|nr:cytochrome bc complex cytochrome b subunit [Deltaproteobacteria bacterium]MBW1993046.1 cytochrome bc complex cytochrome b subunit [Deltaproteobacteria bacterium]